MVQLVAFCRSLGAVSLRTAALALCSAAIVASVSPASAKSHHGARRHADTHHVTRHTGHHYAEGERRYTYRHPRHHPHLARASRWHRGVERMQARRPGRANASLASANSGVTSGGFGSSNIVDEARRYIGGNPTSRASLWCARFMNMVLQHTGHRGTGSDMARSFASYGHRISGPRVGAIAVMSRRGGGGHVGVISGIDARGNPILVSGNNGNRVREAPVSRGQIYAYVMPSN
ncbi:MAG TPA: TIGR02594 family protein [Bradyrhizobium sp.]|nr:TIGR02594 family protein [Bradyrhizobium sp.]